MKKNIFIPTLLIFSLLLNTAGNLLVYVQLRGIFKLTVEERLVGNETNIAFTMFDSRTIERSKDIRIEDGREIIANGHYYDIIKKKETDGRTVYYCIADEAETRLAANFISSFEKNENDSKGTAPVKSSLKNLLQEGVSPLKLAVSSGEPTGITAYTQIINYPLTPSQSVPTPPPEIS